MNASYKNAKFASRLRSLLVQNDFTPQTFADEVGVTQKAVYNWLNGCVPSWRHLEAITTKLNVSTAFVLGLNGGDK